MKKKNSNVAFLISLVILIVAVAVAVVYKVQQAKKEALYDDLVQQVVVESSEPEPDAEPEEQEASKPEIPIDFETLQNQNSDAYAWIRIPDTKVDYPIMQSPENVDYYLDHTFDKKEGLPGSLYTQYNYNPASFADPVTLIYGHNMRDDSFFGGLSEYLNEEFRESHSEVLIYTPDHIYHYEIAFAVTYDNRHILANYDCTQTDQYDAFLTSIQTERKMPSWIQEPFEITSQDHLIVMSTCNGNKETRFLVGAVLKSVE